jgi:antitoxin component of MazEF toxin-antitoxin module
MSKLFRTVQQTRRAKTISIPRDISELLELEKGQKLLIEVENKKIIMTPMPASKHEIDAAETTKSELLPVGVQHEQ